MTEETPRIQTEKESSAMTETEKEPTNNHTNENNIDNLWTQVTSLYRLYVSPETWHQIKLPLAVAAISIVVTGHTGTFFWHVLYPLYWLILRVIAVALGVALGLGFATHVYDQLEVWAGQQRRMDGQEETKNRRNISRKEETQALLMEHMRGSTTTGFSNPTSSSGAVQVQEQQLVISGRQLTKAAPTVIGMHIGQSKMSSDPGASTYVALMASAGYEVDSSWKRGQVVRDSLPIAYPFCDAPLDQQYAVYLMSQEWPTLPAPIVKELGRFMEFIMRDYVSTWYSMIDVGIPYPECVQRAKDKAACLARREVWVEPPPPPPPKPHPFPRRMVLSTASTRSLPLLEHIYRSMAIIFGNLSHRVQDVNVFRLVLLQWTKVIAQTFKVYRQLRKALLDKQSVHKIALFEEARGGVGRAIMRRTVNAVKASSTNLNLNNANNNNNNNNSNHNLRDDTATPTTNASTAGGTAPTTLEDRDHNNNNNINASSDNNESSDETTTQTPAAAYQPVSEIAMTREFLVTGKLHPACTFGLEIPSLLFADPSGQDCGTGVDDDDDDDDDDNNSIEDKSDGVKTKTKRKKKGEDQVLEERLFQTPLIAECELDYNRVLASRIIKLLIPRQDYGSPIVAALLTEIMGGCVLAPIMSCFSPDYLNDWIQKLFDTSSTSSTETETQAADAQEGDEAGSINKATDAGENKRATSAGSQDSEPIMRTWRDDNEGQHNEATTPRARSFSEEGEMILEDCFDQEARKELGELMDLSSNEVGDINALNKEVAEEFLSPTGASTITSGTANESTTGDFVNDEDEVDEDDDMEEDDIILEGATNACGVYHMIMLLDDALLNLQRNMDLEECRRNSNSDSGVEVNWDDPRCKDAVLRLVLVVEALLLHGRRKNPVRIASSHNTVAEEADGDDIEETVEEEFNSGTLTQILMDLTSDIEAFEKLHVKPEDDASDEEGEEEDQDDEYTPTASDLSTLRTLIAAWLHTGQVYRTIRTLVRAKTTVLRPFFHSRAFLRNSHSSAALTRQLKILDGVDVMVDTVAILNSPSIDPEKELLAISEGRNNQQIERVATQQPSSEGSALRSSTESGPSTAKKFGFKGLLDKGMQNLNGKKRALGEKVNKDILKGSLKGRNPLNRTPSSENPLPSVPPPTSLAQPRSNRELSSSNVPASAPVSAPAPATAPAAPASYPQMQASMPGGTPRYLDYHRNEAFASSLRSERDRRTQSWITSIQNDTEMIQFVTRIKGATPEDIAFHRELHHVARIFYAGTNMIGIRDAARSSSAGPRQRLNTADSAQSGLSDYSGNDAQSAEVSLLTVEMACARRRIEVPDDDSSFLLRAQPRALNSMGVHRDTRNADQSYRSFAGSFEEPAVLPGSNKYTGGRFVRRCQIRYYPSDRTASVVMLNDGRKLDQRKGKSIVPETIRFRQSTSPGSVPFLSPEFLQQRHLCQKWIPKGSTSRSQPGMLSSNVMEQADFTASPRTGKALDFVYRMSLFECPMIDLGGKRFTVHDSSAQSAHRADASALEMSDAALSAALLVIGRDYAENVETQTDEMSLTSGNVRNKVEFGPDGYPIIWMKYSRKQNDGSTTTEIKPYRVSFIRAAMLVTSTRQEAQLQCLIKCVRAGSAKSATKARTDAQLRPTLRLLDFARDRSREKQEKLMRDLKLGINHIDREQLRRNALVSPRYPTVIRNIQVSIERALPAGEANVKIPGNPQSIVFKIRCVATVDLVDEEIPQAFLEPYLTKDGKQALTYKETWVIYRAFRDFQALHKHLKSQVAASESSGNAGARLVGAATAAFTAGGAQTNRNRQRKALVPSLGQAGKAGALGVTQRSVAKRMEILDGYLHHLLSTGHHLSRSPELLMFIGAFYPLAPEVQVGKMSISTLNDPLGRAEMSREVLKFAPSSPPQSLGQAGSAKEKFEPNGSIGSGKDEDNDNSQSMIDLQEEDNPKSEQILMTNPAIVAKLDKVPLGQVRKRIFELLSCQFGFENASFLRSRMLSALKTVSFAVTTPGEFRKTLYKTHIEQANPEALAYWINYGIEMLWPDGVFFESSPPLTPEQQKKSAERSRELLHNNFPDQLRTVLGQDLTSDGLDILHEMLQNRMVAKSMFYMLFDLLWVEIFPEMKDVLSCGDALDIDFDDEE